MNVIFVRAAAASALILGLTGVSGCAPVVPVSEYKPCPAAPDLRQSSQELKLSNTAEMDKGLADVERYAGELIGYGEANAEACAIDAGLSWRVVARDGEYYPVTLDYRFNRVNAEITQGKVARTSVG